MTACCCTTTPPRRCRRSSGVALLAGLVIMAVSGCGSGGKTPGATSAPTTGNAEPMKASDAAPDAGRLDPQQRSSAPDPLAPAADTPSEPRGDADFRTATGTQSDEKAPVGTGTEQGDRPHRPSPGVGPDGADQGGDRGDNIVTSNSNPDGKDAGGFQSDQQTSTHTTRKKDGLHAPCPDSGQDANGCRPDGMRGIYAIHNPHILPNPQDYVTIKDRGGTERVVAPGLAHGFNAAGTRLLATQLDAAGNVNLVAMDFDGSHVTQMTSGSTVGPSAFGPNDSVAASMARAGSVAARRRVAWTDAAKKGPEAQTDSDPEIYVLTPDGGSRQLTRNRAIDTTPSWSPDGTRIAYASNQDGNYEIYVMRVDGTQTTRLTTTNGDDFNPTWSPDGTRIAYAGNEDGDFDIYVIPAGGGETKALTENTVDDGFPTWSAKQGIAFSRQVEDNLEIFILQPKRLATGNPRTPKQRLTANDSDDLLPAWTPDGEHIAVTRTGRDRGEAKQPEKRAKPPERGR